jgi:hypothetical protein
MMEEFEGFVAQAIDITSSVFLKVSNSCLLSNPSIDIGFKHENYLEFNVSKGDGAKIYFKIDNNGVELGIEEFSEVFFFSRPIVIDQRAQYEYDIKKILTSKISIERCSIGTNKIFIENEVGEMEIVATRIEGCLSVIALPISIWGFKCKKSVYPPLF